MLRIPVEQFKKLLLEDGILKSEEFDDANQEAGRMHRNISDILISRNLITEDYYFNLVARFYGVQRANLAQRRIDEEVLRLLPEDLARQKRTILFGKDELGTLQAAMEDPSDLSIVEFLTTYLKQKIQPYLATRADMNQGFSFYSRKGAVDFKQVIEDNIKASLQGGEKSEEEAAQDLPVVKITDTVFAYAMTAGASDIHIEALENEVLIRFRIDGIMHEIVRVNKKIHPALVARIKLLANLKLDEHLKPQDGRYRHKIGNDLVDVRVSVMPTFYGEKAEMRLLSTSEHILSFEELGVLPDTLAVLMNNIQKTYGIFLVTGPTGSGKSTTLYSVLNILNKPDVNIVTVEDPIEYNMQYINQTQVNAEAGITFANALRAFLRQDPDVIMVGEIRDEETAEISVHSALTGHLVLSTLHTNDAPTSIPRLIDMHIQPFLVSAVLNAVLAQRLVRRICLDCITSYTPDSSLETMLRDQLAQMELSIDFQMPKVMFKGMGCPSCRHSGYKGRGGIFEIFEVDEEMRNIIVKPDFTLDQIQAKAREKGFITMFEDGLRKVERGMTTIEEVLRVIRE
ncbi:MAG: hypothetical protein COU08_01295 [Candidatus Harrisonbacteria bacterium CG10_big_fil_rev_8_21_14_0_10_42_17]|uniref:Bacterial type II secretion system protein E domain-containing protein n=1 Tax=Candidatus Harrisonbacteria bacterium CG10_big_fil_rev_8_21_14_0_10_42_17 TaxID=1974584 RepID=A0A2M6WIQ4_9BACT|nr:MAG: hypothetical protein COU08_01295 [Candidatus Harrisonbacteria bacterium CG10_big_fil_rev_8_21_14_0_10_42_17]